MTTEEWLWAALASSLGLLALTAIALLKENIRGHQSKMYWLESKRQHNQRGLLLAKAADLARKPLRYEIVIADWGPDFTGVDGVLPRWRWMVWDADRELKMVMEDGPHGEPLTGVGITLPFMLGNEPTYRSAFEAAMVFVETHRHPSLTLDDLPPVVIS